MNFKKKLLFSICLSLLIGIISGCEIGNDKANIYKDNHKIAQEGDSYSFVDRDITEESNDKSEFEYSGFYGVNAIWIIQSKDDGEITFDYDSKVDNGDFKAVLVHPNKEVETVFEGTKKDSKTIKLTEGKYHFKIVGKKAKGNLKISNSKNENVNVRQARIF